MKLILCKKTSDYLLKEKVILESDLKSIDKFTTQFNNKEELLKSILKTEDEEYISNYSIIIEKINKDPNYVIYSSNAYLSYPSSLKSAYVKLKYMNPERIYDYVLNYNTYLLIVPPVIEIEKLKKSALYTICEIIEEENFKSTNRYKAEFTRLFEKNYNTLRDMANRIFTEEEKQELNNEIPHMGKGYFR